ncbi:kinesin-domain-containing protein [Meredithblackwellia eburnea MCA 4105]
MSSHNPAFDSPLGSFVRFDAEDHSTSSAYSSGARPLTPTPRSPFMPVRKHSSKSPPPSPILAQGRITRSSGLVGTNAGLIGATPPSPLVHSSVHNIPAFSFQNASPTESRSYNHPSSSSSSSQQSHPQQQQTESAFTTAAPKIRAKVTPSATPRRKPVLPGTENADIPTPRAGMGMGGSPTKRFAGGGVQGVVATPRVKPGGTPFSYAGGMEMENEIDGLGRGIAGLGLSGPPVDQRKASGIFGGGGGGGGKVLSASKTTTAPQKFTVDRTAGKDNVLVCVRVRPPAAKLAKPAQQPPPDEVAWDVSTEFGSVALYDSPSTEFYFDSVVTGSDNEGVYEAAGKELVLAAMEGFDGVIFAYGQTASGKTFTLSGSPANPGIIPQAVSEIFEYIKDHPEREFLLRASYLEVFNEQLKDLLAPETPGIKMRMDEKKRFFVSPLREEVVTGEAQVAALLRRGEENRHTGKTDFNERSSRSHSVFQITIESRDADEEAPLSTPTTRCKTPNGPRLTPGAGGAVRMSRLSLIDLAGSEQATSQTERRSEGAFINKSLLTLEKVIASLTDDSKKKPHVPYRDSKLTQILQPSLSGEARVSVIATMNPSPAAVEETKSTLKFATRVKRVVLKAQVNEVVDEKALITKYRSHITQLEAQLAVAMAAASNPSVPSTPTVADEEHQVESSKPKKDEKVSLLLSQLSEIKSLFLTSGNIEKRRQSLLPPRPVSPVKMRSSGGTSSTSTSPTIDEDNEDDSRDFEDKYLDCVAELEVAQEEIAALKAQIQELEEARVALPLDADSVEDHQAAQIRDLMKENRELKVITENVSAESEVRVLQRRFEREIAKRDEYAKSVRASLEQEREKTRLFERFVLQGLLSQTAAITGRRRSSIGVGFGAFGSGVGGFQPLMAESPDLAAISPEYVGLDAVDEEDEVQVQDLKFSDEAKERITRSGSTLFVPIP